MTRKYFGALCILLFTVVLISCDKAEEVARSGKMSATVDSTAFVATQVTAKRNGAIITVTGNVNNLAIELRLQGYNNSNSTYQLLSTGSIAVYSSGSNNLPVSSVVGQVDVTNGSASNIAGTFSFITSDSLHITKGVFEALIQ